MPSLIAFLCGAVFALGLVLAGMTQPEKILGFLDVTGHWDPSLLLVMGGAVGLTSALFPRILKRGRPVLAEGFDLPVHRSVDARLIGGAAIFGVGWGLSGYCPGPAVVSLVTADAGVTVFVACLFLGLAAGRWITGRQSTPVTAAEGPGETGAAGPASSETA